LAYGIPTLVLRREILTMKTDLVALAVYPSS
jgi:hypothetical protein